MRVVFDTNVLVSALVFPGRRGDEALQRILDERDELLATFVKPGRRISVLRAGEL